MKNNHISNTQLLTLLMASLLFVSCSSSIISVSNDGYTITKITMEQNGVTDQNQPSVVGICKGFLLSDKQVRDFFVNATYIKDTAQENRYDILPCYSAGKAIINGDPHNWIIRAGGIGEFSNDSNKFMKICGKDCCEKVAGIC